MLPFKLFSHTGFTVDLGAHVFPAQKYRLVRERLLEAGVADHGDIVTPRAAGDDELEHDRRADLELVRARWDRRDGSPGVVDDRERAVHRVLNVERRQGGLTTGAVACSTQRCEDRRYRHERCGQEESAPCANHHQNHLQV